jgi:enamine deaminase RidA (YjgF/YER057c/UK114 family)
MSHNAGVSVDEDIVMANVEGKLRELGIVLPATSTPSANYVPRVRSGSLLFLSGQVCLGLDGKLAPAHTGRVGGNLTPEIGYEAARLCAIQLLAQAKGELGDLDRITRCVRLGGFIQAAPDYFALPTVMNGASDLFVAVLGDKGRHARTTVGVAVLPFDAAVEVDAILEVH